MRLLTVVLMISVLLLSACASSDVDGMRKGLIKDGMTASQAECYANNLGAVIGADEYNNLAQLMQQGVSMKDAIQKTRRKYGSDFKTKMSANSDKLDGCLK